MRRGAFSLLYEIIGLIIFAITALIWFGGIESIIGSLTGSNAVNSFNQLTSAIKGMCSSPDANEVLLTGLDLQVYGSTYIVTQLRIPQEFVNDELTMGFIQPQMRKCIGANCLCLLELKEAEGNWQMCTTSDWDTWSLRYAPKFGAPGCPFWYYAPPDVLEQSIQNILDFLEIDALQIALAFLKENPSAEEHYSYVAPEMWGGCSNANEQNLTISSFEKESATFDCSKIDGKLLYSFYGKTKTAVLNDIKSDFYLGFLNDSSAKLYYNTSVGAQFKTQVVSSVPTKLNAFFSNYINTKVFNDYVTLFRSEFDTRVVSKIDSLKSNYDETINLLVSDGLVLKAGETVSSCSAKLIDKLASTVDNAYFSFNIITPPLSVNYYERVGGGVNGLFNFTIDKPLSSIDTVNINLSVKRVPYYAVTCSDGTECFFNGDSLIGCPAECSFFGSTVYCPEAVCQVYSLKTILGVKAGDCLDTKQITSESESIASFEFKGSCFETSSVIEFYEANNDDRELEVKVGATIPSKYAVNCGGSITECELINDNFCSCTCNGPCYPNSFKTYCNSVECSVSKMPRSDLISDGVASQINNDWLINISFNDLYKNREVVDSAITSFSTNIVGSVLSNYNPYAVTCSLTGNTFSCTDTTRIHTFNYNGLSCAVSYVVACDGGVTCTYDGTALSCSDSSCSCGSSCSVGANTVTCNKGTAQTSDDNYCSITAPLSCNNDTCAWGYDGIKCLKGLECSAPSACVKRVTIDSYANEINNTLNAINFNSITDKAFIRANNFYTSFFDNYVNLVVFKEDNSYCKQLIRPNNDLVNTFPNLRGNLSEEMNNQFSTLTSLPSLDLLNLNYAGIDLTPDYYFEAPFSSFSLSMALEQSYQLRDALAECFAEDSLAIDLRLPLLVNNYSSLINQSLLDSINDIKNAFYSKNTQSLFINAPKSFVFKNEFSNERNKSSLLTDSFISYQTSSINNGLRDIGSLINDEINEEISTAWSSTGFSEVNCWPGFNEAGEKIYFKGYPTVNDVLAWNQYTSVSRLTPAILAFEAKLLSYGLELEAQRIINGMSRVDASTTMDDSGKVSSKSESYLGSGLTKDEYTAEMAKIDKIALDSKIPDTTGWTDVEIAQYEALTGFDLSGAIVASGNPLLDYMINNQSSADSRLTSVYSSITGRGLFSAIKWAFTAAGKEAIKAFLKKHRGELIRLTIVFAAIIAVNVWRNSLITNMHEEVVRYSDGGIRTFNPELVNVQSCVRMDELGCPVTQSVWVNESFYCQTDVYVRRLVNPETWMKFIKNQDTCRSVLGPEQKECSIENKYLEDKGDKPVECLKDTLTSCYKLRCDVTGENGDRYHVFQYWVGAGGDPAGIVGTSGGNIDGLRIYWADAPNKAWDGKLMMEVIGGNESAKLPASII